MQCAWPLVMPVTATQRHARLPAPALLVLWRNSICQELTRCWQTMALAEQSKLVEQAEHCHDHRTSLPAFAGRNTNMHALSATTKAIHTTDMPRRRTQALCSCPCQGLW
jgi:hypothetical protein